MKWWLRYLAAKAHGIWLRRTGQMFKNAITVRELVTKAELNPERREHLRLARLRFKETARAKACES